MGGNAVPNAGTIYISEVDPTLSSLEKQFGLFQLRTKVYGSVGKKEYSGDIDIVMDPDTEILLTNLLTTLREQLGENNVRCMGAMISICYPITNYDETKIERLPRTGNVQVDFLYADPVFTKVFHFSAGNASKFKGVHRNIALSAISAHTERVESVELDDQHRSKEVTRWKWSPYGLFKIQRNSVFNEHTDKYNKMQKDVQISGEIKDPKKIVQILFHETADESCLDSLETVIAACVRYFDKEKQNKVFSIIVRNIEEYNNKNAKVSLVQYGLPDELTPFATTRWYDDHGEKIT